MRKRLASLVVVVAAACMAWMLCACSESYQPQQQQAKVAPEALSTAGTLRVGVNASSYPFAGTSKSGVITGIDVDVAAALADQMGLKLELVDVGMDGPAAVSNGSADVVMGLDNADVDGGACWLSEGYLDSCIVLFSADENAQPPVRSDAPLISAQEASLSAWYVTQQYGTEALKASDDLKQVFQGLADGSVTCAAADAVVGSYIVNTMGMKAAPIGLMEQPSAYCVGVGTGNAALQEALAQALSDIKANGVLSVVQAKWLGSALDLSGAKPTEAVQQAADAAAQQQEAPAEQAPAEQAPAEQAPADDAVAGANAVTFE